MKRPLTVVSSPHISSPDSTDKIMLKVSLALVPAGLLSIYWYGIRAALVIAVAVVSCVLFEYLWCRLMKKPSTLWDFSAVVTGILLAFNIPSTIPLWMVLVGSFVSIIIVKQLFGGLGCNFVNPALAGRVTMALSFPAAMTNYGYPENVPDALSGATPLALMREGAIGGTDYIVEILLGNRGDIIGAGCTLALLVGGIYLMLTKVIKPTIPLVYIGSTFVLLMLFGNTSALLSILSGGLILGAFFMATDYVTSPYTDKGKVIFAIGLGLLTAVLRTYSNMTEGVSFAILIMNLLVPYINDLTRRRPFGEVKKNEK